MKIGFEFEFSSPLSFYRVHGSLKREFGLKWYDKVISHVTTDYSIRGPRGNLQMELVTNPLPRRDAYKVLSDTIDWIKGIDATTNFSTGLHANYSDLRVQHRLNPVSVLTTIDTVDILRDFNRVTNKYCRPWEFYLKKIRKRNRDQYRGGNLEDLMFDSVGKVITSEVDSFASSVVKFMHWVHSGSDMDRADKFSDRSNREAIYLFDVKRCSLNIGYVQERGYIESRMIGGNYVKKKDLVIQRVEDVEAGLLIACDQKYNIRKNYNFLRDFYLT